MSGKVAIITGASSGIGRSTAIGLSNAGWCLVLFARRKALLEETQKLCANADECLLIEGDVTSEGDVINLFSTSVERFGRVDLLFNNAGISTSAIPTEALPLSTFQNVINVNLIGTFLCTREAFKVFKSQSPRGGRIINNGSLAAHVPRPHSIAYATTKHAMTGLTKSTALDGREFDISCTQIDIGNAHTDMAGGHSLGALQPDGRLIPEATMDVKHVADSIVHIADLPLNVTVLNYTIMATKVPYVGRG